MVFEFQSTPPVWGATMQSCPCNRSLINFNPRPPCGGRRGDFSPGRDPEPFQSTPPVWGATDIRPKGCYTILIFQSTPPVWGATRFGFDSFPSTNISIHAPRVGGDIELSSGGVCTFDFNPRPPCGGRRIVYNGKCQGDRISIHAPRVGGDR